MLDNQEDLAEVTEQPRFLPWEFDTVVEHRLKHHKAFLHQEKLVAKKPSYVYYIFI